MRRLIAAVALCFLWNFPAEAQRRTVTSGTTPPTGCEEGQVFIDTDATSGQRVYACESGTFVLQGDGGGGFTTIDTDYGDETVTATWSFNDIADRTWSPQTFDLSLGDAVDEGQLRLGAAFIGQADDTISTTVLDDVFIMYNPSDSIENISFMYVGTGDVPRFVIAEEGSGLATYNPRSLAVGPAATMANVDENITCSTNFDEIDCDTGGTGADLGVQDDVAVGGTVWLDAGDGDGFSIGVVGASATADSTFTVPNTTGTAAVEGAAGADHIDALTEIAQSIKSAANDTDVLAVYTGALPSGTECVQMNSSGQLDTTGAACGTSGGDPVLIDGTNVIDGLGVDLIGGTNGIDISFSSAASPDTATFNFDGSEVAANALASTTINTIRQSFSWAAGAMSTDGTNCADPTEQTLNSGPKQWAFSCADNASSIFYGQPIVMPDSWDGNAVTFELTVFHETTESITFAGDFSAQCRGDSETVSSTWGTGVAADVSITTANDIEQQTSGDVTPDGTCAGGDTLWWRYVVDTANFSTNAANAEVIAVKMEWVSNVGD